jgi:DNA replication and repair protein RecF
LAWLLAHARLLKTENGQAPLVLFDEVLAHLDETVCEKVLSELTELGAQIWLAGTEATPFLASCSPLLVHVEEGQLHPQPRLVKKAS